jgi:4-amino-4-deoxy-L-arabinose transferase-like glycosyltransferase
VCRDQTADDSDGAANDDCSLRSSLAGRDARAVVAIALVLAFAVRVGFVLATRNYVPLTDASDYQRIAESVASGHGFGASVVAPAGGASAFRPPLYPITLGVFYQLFGVHIVLARLAQAALGTVTVGLIGLLSFRLFGRRVAGVTLVLAAVYPPLVFSGGALLTETLAIPLEIGATLAALHVRHSSRPLPFVALTGALAGLGVLNRPNTALQLVPFVILAGTTCAAWAAVRRGALLVVTAALVLVPWLVRDYRAFDEFVPLTNQSGLVMAGTYNATSANDPVYPAGWRPANLVPEYAAILSAHPDLNEVELERRFRTEALSYVRQHPTYTLRVAFYNTMRVFDLRDRPFAQRSVEDLGYSRTVADLWVNSYFVVGVLAIAGALLARTSRAPKAVWLVPIAVVLSTVFLQGFTRLRAGIEPFLVVLAAIALDRAIRAVSSRRSAGQPESKVLA